MVQGSRVVTRSSWKKIFVFSLLSCAALPCAALAQESGPDISASKQADMNARGADPFPAQADNRLVAIINGSALTHRDVEARERLYAISSGIRISDETMARLRPQIVHQLIDERLRTEEMLKRHINISPKQIAEAIAGIEQRNGMPSGSLRSQLNRAGIPLSTLIDQIRVQLGWTQVLRQELGDRARIKANEIALRQDALKREEGQPEYLVNEIFIPVDDPQNAERELKVTEIIIQQLRNGAPFPIVAAQFSQSQSALAGGALGWVQEDALDPAVVQVARAMPVGAISNPIRVAGGYAIITLGGRRKIGHQEGTEVHVRQVFLPFSSTLDPHHPTPQQAATLQKATQLSRNIHSCTDMEAANKAAGEKHPSDPGILQLERLNPAMRQIISSLPDNQVSRPLVSPDGINLIMVCSRQTKNFSDQSPGEIATQLLNERVEQVARRVNRDLRRRAIIDIREKDLHLKF